VVDPDGSGDLDAVLAAAQDGGAVVLLTRDAYASPPAATLVEAIGRGPVPRVHVALRNPLDLTLPGPAARVAAYADTPATIRALAACLTGRAPFRGRLPVRLRGLEPASTRSVA
jgi:hypothetical protein